MHLQLRVATTELGDVPVTPEEFPYPTVEENWQEEYC